MIVAAAHETRQPTVWNFVGSHQKEGHAVYLGKELVRGGHAYEANVVTQSPVLVGDRIIIGHGRGFAVYRVCGSKVGRMGARHVAMVFEPDALNRWLATLGDKGVCGPTMSAQTTMLELLPSESAWPLSMIEDRLFVAADKPSVATRELDASMGALKKGRTAVWLVNDDTGEAILAGSVFMPTSGQVEKLFRQRYQSITRVTQSLVARLEDKHMAIGPVWKLMPVLTMGAFAGATVLALPDAEI